jgi:NAD(P)-dependent dehydrogenase (short-subunit alcohol dehydrogenase family)
MQCSTVMHVCMCMCVDKKTLSKCACVAATQVCDVSSLASVSAFASEWRAAARPLYLLVNNAGVLVCGTQHLATAQGNSISCTAQPHMASHVAVCHIHAYSVRACTDIDLQCTCKSQCM